MKVQTNSITSSSTICTAKGDSACRLIASSSSFASSFFGEGSCSGIGSVSIGGSFGGYFLAIFLFMVGFVLQRKKEEDECDYCWRYC